MICLNSSHAAQIAALERENALLRERIGLLQETVAGLEDERRKLTDRLLSETGARPLWEASPLQPQPDGAIERRSPSAIRRRMEEQSQRQYLTAIRDDAESAVKGK